MASSKDEVQVEQFGKFETLISKPETQLRFRITFANSPNLPSV